MAVTPISPISGPLGASSAGRLGSTPGAAGKGNFARALKSYVAKVDQDQRHAGAAVGDLVAGKSPDVLPVVSAVAKADMSFKLLVGVRNKVIEAYKQTMNMQI